MVHLSPGGLHHRTVAEEGVEQGAGEHAGLVGHQLGGRRPVISQVPDMVLRPGQVVHHQPKEEEEPKEMCPDVDGLIVEPEYTPETSLIVQGGPVASGYGAFFCIIRNIRHA